MSNYRMLIAAAVGLAALGGCKPSQSTPPPSRAPAAKVVGKPLSCIPLRQIVSTKVHDDRTIDFVGSGKRVWRNTLPLACPRLGFEEGFTYETSLSQLCSTDIIYVLERSGTDLRRGAGCGLGQFVPVELEKK